MVHDDNLVALIKNTIQDMDPNAFRSEPLLDAIKQHPDFCSRHDRFFLGKQVSMAPEMQLLSLVRYAKRDGAKAALDWYRRVIATDRTHMRVVGQVLGLHVKECHRFPNGLYLTSLGEMWDNPYLSHLRSESMPGALGFSLPSFITLDIPNVKSEDPTIGHEKYTKVVDEMRDTINAYVLSGEGAPIVSETWVEFVDPDLQMAEIGRTWSMSRTEGSAPFVLANVTSKGLEWVERYLGLPEDIKRKCQTPVVRLNLARRRMSAGDKALDGCISLEALLSGKARGELTHRLSVRTALLLGRTLGERQTIAKKVRALYELRSNVVHASDSKKAEKAQMVAEQGLELCLSAIRAIVEHRQMPEPELWELQGGPDWNRPSSVTED